jgi:glycerol 3-phosphatase-2
MTLADQFDGFLIDLDGVVWVGREPVPGAAEVLTALLEDGKKIVFVTNNPGKPAAAYAERLGGMGVEAADDKVVTAGMATTRLAAERVGAGRTAFVIGTDSFREEAAAAGLEVLDGEAGREAAAVLVSGHRGFNYEELLTATLALQRGAELFATSRDPTLPMPGGPWPGTGAVLAAVETASGAHAEIGGKPERHLFDLALHMLRCSFAPNKAAKEQRNGLGGKRVAMVGDRLTSDIEGGRRAGLATVLVLTGACTREEAERANPPPDYVVDNLTGLLG